MKAYQKGWFYQTPKNWGIRSKQTETTTPRPDSERNATLKATKRKASPERYNPERPDKKWREKGARKLAERQTACAHTAPPKSVWEILAEVYAAADDGEEFAEDILFGQPGR